MSKMIIERITSSQELAAMCHAFSMTALEAGKREAAIYWQGRQAAYSATARKLNGAKYAAREIVNGLGGAA